MLESPQVSPLSQLQPVNNQTHFDQATGTLFLFGDSVANTFQQAIAPSGYLELAIDNNKYSSDTQSPFFAPFLIGATNSSIQTITLDGGDGEDKLILGGQLVSPNLSITADDSIDITGSLTATNNLSILSDKLTLNQATLTATDSNDGGTIHLLGKDISVINSAIKASGSQSGGTILIGGDYQGKGSVPNAKNTYIGSDVQINADATQTGNGGKVIVWADDTTEYFGNITARGGATSGDGGFAEVSGKQNLKYRGQADLGSTAGKLGTLLLDPTDIYIYDFFTPDGESFLNSETLNQQTGNISLVADRHIYVISPLNFVPSPGASLSFTATSGFFSASADIIAPGRNVSISASLGIDHRDISTASSDSNGGTITLNHFGNTPGYDRDIVGLSLNTSSGSDKGGNVTITSNVGDFYMSSISTSGATGGGNVDISTKQSIYMANYLYSYDEATGEEISLGVLPSISSVSGSGNAGNINLTNSLGVSSTGAHIYTTGIAAYAGGSGNGGSINLDAANDIINLGPIASNSDGTGNGGNVTLISNNGKINTTSIATNSIGTGNGGDVTLTSDQGDITADYIRSDSAGGTGGDITLDAAEFVKVIDSVAINGIDYSIYADGAVGDSEVTIEYNLDSGLPDTDFILGDSSTNGTQGSIGATDSGIFEISTPFIIPNNYEIDNITIATSGNPPVTQGGSDDEIIGSDGSDIVIGGGVGFPNLFPPTLPPAFSDFFAPLFRYNEWLQRGLISTQTGLLHPTLGKGYLTSDWGDRVVPPPASLFHNGIDISASIGTPIVAVAPGVVKETGSDGGRGNYIIIRHKNNWETRMFHMFQPSTLSIGAPVKQGDYLGGVGNTGASQGSHLHIELRRPNGDSVDIEFYLNLSRTPIDPIELADRPVGVYRTLPINQLQGGWF